VVVTIHERIVKYAITGELFHLTWISRSGISQTKISQNEKKEIKTQNTGLGLCTWRGTTRYDKACAHVSG